MAFEISLMVGAVSNSSITAASIHCLEVISNGLSA